MNKLLVRAKRRVTVLTGWGRVQFHDWSITDTVKPLLSGYPLLGGQRGHHANFRNSLRIFTLYLTSEQSHGDLLDQPPTPISRTTRIFFLLHVTNYQSIN